MKKAYFLIVIASVLFSFSGKKVDFFPEVSLRDFEKSLALIPKGFYIVKGDMDTITFSVEYKTIKVDSFYIRSYEVSNIEYREFIKEIRKKDKALSKDMLPDTVVWKTKLAYNDPFVEHYYRHPAYNDYPVVGITYEQAEYYCKWLTEKYMQEERRKFKKVQFKLPTVKQWRYAANGGRNLVRFPWGGPSMQHKKGQWMANFWVIEQHSIYRRTFKVPSVSGNELEEEFPVGRSRSSGTNAGITAPVLSYYSNGYGLYNMAGNVEEYMKEKGITKGGSWMDTGYYLQNSVEENYDSTNYVSEARGFRFVMELVK